MDRERFSAIAHGDLPYWNPIGTERFEALLDTLCLPVEAEVLDIGCGRGAGLSRLAANRPWLRGTGVDPSALAIDQAQSETAAAALSAQLRWHQAPYRSSDFADASQDLVLVLGASHAVGDMPATLAEARRLLRPGGQLLLAEGYWQQSPSAEYLSFLAAAEEDLLTHQGNIERCQGAGFEVRQAIETSQAEWDDYENSYAANMLRYLAANPQDADGEAMRERITRWHETYLQHGRGVLGFGLYHLILSAT